MPVTIDVTNENFVAIAIAAGYVPRAQVEGYARHIAGELLKQHGITPPWPANDQPGTVAPMETTGEGSYPAPHSSAVAEAAKASVSPAALAAAQRVAQAVPAATEVKRRPGRPAKAAPTAALTAAETFAETVEKMDENDQPKEYTIEDVKNALRELAARIDIGASRALLDHFGAKKASEVPVEKIRDFVVASHAGPQAKTIEEFVAALKADLRGTQATTS